MVTNPPYGQRVRGGPDLRDLYAQLGNVLRDRCPGWVVTILSSDRTLLAQTGLKLESSLTTSNGGIDVVVARGVIKTSIGGPR
jgi:putative N6-adenine-specific DNA methylase